MPTIQNRHGLEWWKGDPGNNRQLGPMLNIVTGRVSAQGVREALLPCSSLGPEVIFASLHWRGGRVVDCGRLEIYCGATHRGFKSLPLRLSRPWRRGQDARARAASRG